MHNSWSGRRVLVTGGLGFIGSHLVVRLCEYGASVSVVDRIDGRFGGRLQNLEPCLNQVAVHDVDLRDADAMADILVGQDVIFSLAGQVSHSCSMSNPLPDLDLNCRCQLQMLETLRQHNPPAKFVFASTRQIYGRAETLPVTEQHPVRPVDVNGVSKLATEHLLRLYSEIYGLQTVSLRLTNVYGPRMDLTSPGRGFINVCMRNALAGGIVQIFGDGQQIRDFLFVEDAVDAFLLAGQCEDLSDAAFNVSGAAPISLLSFVDALRHFVEFRIEIVPFPSDREQIDVGDYVGCSQLLERRTGWQPRTSLMVGLRKTIQWYQQNWPHPGGPHAHFCSASSEAVVPSDQL